MTQIATIERIIDQNHAVISVARKTACGHDCDDCAGCGISSGAAVKARAVNPIGAKPGQKVVVESDTQKMLRIVAFVYVTPLVLFILGYVLMVVLNASVAIQYSVAGIGFVLGIMAAIRYDRHLRDLGGVSFTIVRLF